MSPVYIFGGSPKPTIITNENFIERFIEKEEFIAKPTFYLSNLIKGFIIDKNIELTRMLISFGNEKHYDNLPIYWTDKTLIINISNSLLPREP